MSELTPTGSRTPARPPKRASLIIRAPECPACQNPPSHNKPIKNLELARLIRLMVKKQRKSTTYVNPLYSLPESTSPTPSS
jgi:hypothetical protein